MKKGFIIFIHLFIAYSTYAQLYEPYKVNYGTDDGLPSSECYEIIQDSKGYIWFGTDRGVVKYNGYEYTTYTTKDGLNNNVVFYLSEDEKGRIWFYDKTHYINYIEKDTIYPYQYNSVLKKYISDISYPLGLYVQNNNVYISTIFQNADNKKLYCIDKEGQPLFHDEFCDYSFANINNHLISTFKQPRNDLTNEIDHDLNLCLVDSNYSITGNFFLNKNNLFYPSNHRYIKSGNSIFFNMLNGLYRFNNNGEVELLTTFNKGIIELESDNEGNIYVGLFDEGLWVIPKGDLNKKFKIMSGYSVSGFLKDNKGGIWLTTLEKGLFYIPSMAVSIYKPTEGKAINHINGNLKDLLYTTKEGEIYALKNNTPIPLAFDKPFYIRSIVKFNSNNFLFPLSSTYSYLYKDIHIKPEVLYHVSSIDWHENDTALFGTQRGFVFQLLKSDIKNPIFMDTCDVQITSLCNDFENNLLLGSNHGMYIYDGEKIKKAFLNDSIYTSRITDIGLFKNKFLLTSTRGNGLIIHPKDSIPYTLTKEFGLISNELDKIYINGYHIYITSKEGLSLIKYDNENFSIVNYSNKNGLLSNEVNEVFERDDTAWVATNNGITKINLIEDDQSITSFPIYLKNILVNGLNYTIDSTITLSYNQNELEFFYEAISYKNQGNINYRYQLKGLDKKWSYTSSRNIRYPRLPPGNYQFYISYEKNQGQWSQPILLTSIVIKKPFWEEIWFYILMITFFILIIWLVIKRYIKKIKRETEIKQTIMDLERRAIQAQMNPHFIFNALTSIQSLIVQNKNDKAQQFLVTFSRLVRTALNHSSLTYVPLNQEIQLIKNYLKLESLRFINVFEYEINIDIKNHTEDIEIPPMVIQPFIENAIEHGLLKKESKGFLKIDIIQDETTLLKCKIEDNGVGRETSSAIPKRKGRESKGIKLVKDRLTIINKNAKVEIEDLYNDGTPSGTLVKLFLPFKITQS